MSHRYRFFATERDGAWLIEDEEQEHLNRVLRLKAGDEVEVFDGKGRWGVGKILTTSRKETVVTNVHATTEPKSDRPLIVLLGVLKPGVVDDVLPGLVEAGADRIMIYGQRDIPSNHLSEKVVQRWQRIASAACKQSKRPWLPEVELKQDLGQALASVPGTSTRLVLDPDAKASLLKTPLQGPVVVVIGGEKGLDPMELGMLSGANFLGVKAGPHVLRARTAVLVATAVLAMRREA